MITMTMREQIISYLEQMVDNNLFDKRGNEYRQDTRRRIYTITINADHFLYMEQERMQPSEWYQTEYAYDDAALKLLKKSFGSV